MDGLDLRVLRIKAGLTQWELAKVTGINPARISEMETGKRQINPAVVDALDQLNAARALGSR